MVSTPVKEGKYDKLCCSAVKNNGSCKYAVRNKLHTSMAHKYSDRFRLGLSISDQLQTQTDPSLSYLNPT